MTTRARVVLLTVPVSLCLGCAGGGPFIYKESPPVAGVSPLNLRAVVVPFDDATDNFKTRDRRLGSMGQFNLAKTGWKIIGGGVSSLDVSMLGDGLARECRSQGLFSSVEFDHSRERRDADVVLEGSIRTATLRVRYGPETTVFFELGLRVRKIADGAVVWEGRSGLVEDKSLAWASYQRHTNRFMNELVQKAFATLLAGVRSALGRAATSERRASDTESVENILQRVNSSP